MFKIIVEYSDYKSETFELCTGYKVDQLSYVLQLVDGSVHYINRNLTKKLIVWDLDKYRRKEEYDGEISREMEVEKEREVIPP